VVEVRERWRVMAKAKKTPSKKISEARAMKAIQAIKRARLHQGTEKEARAALKELEAFIRQEEREVARRTRELKSQMKALEGED